MHDWSGVHVSGPSAMDNYSHILREWAGQRLPLMSEGGVGTPGSNMVTAPHFPIRARAWKDNSTNIGKGNVLFTDGSVETFSFGH